MKKKALERFMENILSVKVWCILIATGLICTGFLTGTQFTALIATILGVREVFKVSKIKWGNGSAGDINI